VLLLEALDRRRIEAAVKVAVEDALEYGLLRIGVPEQGHRGAQLLGVDAAVARKNLQRINAVIEKIANRYGHVVDLHAHFLTGDPSWFTATIEPSLRGASEVRRAFLPYVLGKA